MNDDPIFLNESTSKDLHVNKQVDERTTFLQYSLEEERKKIAREIHDEFVQQLVSLKMDISWLNKNIPNDSILKQKSLEILSSIDHLNGTLRNILINLRPSILDDFGLIAAIEWQNKEFEKKFRIKCQLDILISELAFDKNLSIGVYRIFQEAMTNIAKHAIAKKVQTTLKTQNTKLVMTISDDGIGFDNIDFSQKKSFGIIGMKERALLLNGIFKIKSIKNKGTTVKLIVPLLLQNQSNTQN